MSDFAVRIRDLSKEYRIGEYETGYRGIRGRLRGLRDAASHEHETIWALRNVGFDVGEGEVVGIVGRNGAGKSTLLKILSRITEPTTGFADIRGTVGSLLEVGTGFQGELTGRENIYLNGALLGMRRSEVRRKFDEIVEFAGVQRFIDTPVKRYSSGMFVRLAFAVAAHLEPDILIVDEVLAVGDAEFQKRCLGKMGDVAREGRTILFVSHNMQAVRALCTRAVLLEQGTVVLDAETETVVRQYLRGVAGPEAGSKRWHDPESRPGDAHCRLVEVRVENTAGEPVATVMSGEPTYVTLEVDVQEAHSSLTVGFDLVTPDGISAFRTLFTDAPDESRVTIREGRNVLRCEIPAGFLNAGRFIVSPHASLHWIRWIFQEPGALEFDVVFGHGESPFLASGGRPGVVAPILEWSVAYDRERGRVAGA